MCRCGVGPRPWGVGSRSGGPMAGPTRSRTMIRIRVPLSAVAVSPVTVPVRARVSAASTGPPARTVARSRGRRTARMPDARRIHARRGSPIPCARSEESGVYICGGAAAERGAPRWCTRHDRRVFHSCVAMDAHGTADGVCVWFSFFAIFLTAFLSSPRSDSGAGSGGAPSVRPQMAYV